MKSRPSSLANILCSVVLLFTISFPLASTSSEESSGVAKPKAPKGVIKLDSRNFESSIRDGNPWLIEFYAPWCGHCTRFAPTYESIAQKLHGMHQTEDGEANRKVMVAKVDGAAERALSSRFNVKGYPTFFLVDGWTVREFDGQRSMDSLVKFATVAYEDTESVPFLHSPFGPIGQLRALFMLFGTKILDSYEYLVDSKGLSPLFAAGIMCSAGIFIGLVAIILIGVLALPKPKVD